MWLSDPISRTLCCLKPRACAEEELSVGLRVGWRVPTSSRAWWAFVASASSAEPGWVLFRMFYRTNNRQEPGERRDGKKEEVTENELTKLEQQVTLRKKGVGSGQMLTSTAGVGKGQKNRLPLPWGSLRSPLELRGEDQGGIAIPGAAV